MKRLAIVLSLAALALAAVVASAAGTALRGAALPRLPLPAGRAHATVTPRHGNASTRFVVRFRNLYRTGGPGALRVWEVASVSDRTQTGGCTSQMSLRLAPMRADRTVRFTLAPQRRWCAGRYAGTITLYREIACQGPPTRVSKVIVCPEVAIALVPIGRFRFRVGRPATA